MKKSNSRIGRGEKTLQIRFYEEGASMTSEIAKNKMLVAEFLARFSEGAISEAAKLMASDSAWIVMGRLEGMSGRYSRDNFVQLADSARVNYRSGALQILPGVMTAEDDRVSVVASGHAELSDGRTYCPDYHFLFTVSDNRIVEVREYMDTQHARDVFFS